MVCQEEHAFVTSDRHSIAVCDVHSNLFKWHQWSLSSLLLSALLAIDQFTNGDDVIAFVDNGDSRFQLREQSKVF